MQEDNHISPAEPSDYFENAAVVGNDAIGRKEKAYSGIGCFIPSVAQRDMAMPCGGWKEAVSELAVAVFQVHRDSKAWYKVTQVDRFDGPYEKM